MARRRASIDPNLFARTESEPEDTSTQAHKHESVQASKHESVQASKPESAQARKAATFYFDLATLEALERAWLDARRAGKSMTKSAIVEAALRAWLEEGNPTEHEAEKTL